MSLVLSDGLGKVFNIGYSRYISRKNFIVYIGYRG